MDGKIIFSGKWQFECLDVLGKPKWREEIDNLITNQGLNHILDTEFHNNTVVSTWYVGLKHAGAANAADNMTSHGGWAECANYTGSRPAFDEAAPASGSITNNASKASFSINANNQVIAGGFLCSVASGTAGTLFSVVDFTGGNKTCDNGDTLQVTYTLSANSV